MIEPGVIAKSLGEIGTTILYILAATLVLEAILYLILVRWLRWKYALPTMLLAPAIVGLMALVIYPMIWELNISFTNMSLRHFKEPEYTWLELPHWKKNSELMDLNLLKVTLITLCWDLILL